MYTYTRRLHLYVHIYIYIYIYHDVGPSSRPGPSAGRLKETGAGDQAGAQAGDRAGDPGRGGLRLVLTGVFGVLCGRARTSMASGVIQPGIAADGGTAGAPPFTSADPVGFSLLPNGLADIAANGGGAGVWEGGGRRAEA